MMQLQNETGGHMNKWRVKAMCNDCPFASRGEGLHLRRSLAPGRWPEILGKLKKGGHFFCHKTTVYDDEGEAVRGSGKICAGSIAWQAKRGIVADFVQIAERFDIILGRQKISTFPKSSTDKPLARRLAEK